MNIILKHTHGQIRTKLGAFKKDPIYNSNHFLVLKRLLDEKKILESPAELDLLKNVLEEWISIHESNISQRPLKEIEENRFQKLSPTFDLLYYQYMTIKNLLYSGDGNSLWNYTYFSNSKQFSVIAKSVLGELNGTTISGEIKNTLEELISFGLINKSNDEFKASRTGVWLYKSCRSEI